MPFDVVHERPVVHAANVKAVGHGSQQGVSVALDQRLCGCGVWGVGHGVWTGCVAGVDTHAASGDIDRSSISVARDERLPDFGCEAWSAVCTWVGKAGVGLRMGGQKVHNLRTCSRQRQCAGGRAPAVSKSWDV
eukprot:365076-Chlamydomonas_euryale.AAC.10